MMNEQEQKTYDRLLDKSQEAFILAIELYNRPSIRYHAEGCSFFLCNAWELMLKAKIINDEGEDAIYYADKNRTLSLSDCLKKVFNNENDPVRKNMRAVNNLRNTSTHFVVDEYELFYGPIFNESVKLYDEKLKDLHGIEISDRIPENYLTLSVRRGAMHLDTIRARYPRQVVEKMLTLGADIVADRKDSDGELGYVTEFRQSKKKDADFTFSITSDADTAVAIIKSLTEPVDKYTYRVRTGVEHIRKKLQKKNVRLLVKGEETEFNRVHFMEFVSFYNMKGNETYSYDLSLGGEQPSWCYSQQAIDLMIDALERDPEHAIDSMRDELRKRNEK